MTVGRALKAAMWLALAAGGIVAAGFAWVKLAPRHVPAGQASLARLDAATLPAFRDTFNASEGKVRVVAMLSPT